MKWLISVILFSALSSYSQSSCSDIEFLSIKELNSKTEFPNVVYFKIRKDSIRKKLSLSGDYESIVISPSECNKAGSNLTLDTAGLIIPTEDMINSGVCYCNTCIENYSKFSLSEDLIIKVVGANSIKAIATIEKEAKKLNWYEKKLKSGDKISLKNILFIGGRAVFRSISFKDLNRLVSVLENNPKVNVEIQGHVNSPGKRNTKESQGLSDERAKAVVAYLIKKGIAKERLTAKGYGNTMMLYPKAKTEYEMQFNRRVEVLVE